MSLRRALVLLLVACGPSAPMTDDDATTTSDESSSTTASLATTTSTATSAPPDPTTSTSATDTTDVSSTGTTDEFLFIVTSDFGCFISPRSSHCSADCDPFTQNCPDGQKCTPWANDGGSSWNSTKCEVLDPDPDHAGDPCTVEISGLSGIDSCDLHSMCWDVDDDTLTGTCVPFCTGSIEMGMCPDDLLCAVYNEGVLPLCLPRCDPLQQDCPVDELCIDVPDGTGFLCIPDASLDEGQAFDTCSFANTCDPGLFCGPSEAASECDPIDPNCCLPFCDLTLPPNCPGALQTCQPYFGMNPAPPGYEDVGRCALP